ncbi:MAG: CDP-glucose 4,6-dehydratase [Candidatus Nanopelagicales bacterium]|nr:CDP-glucose 4,6-dehydratase [Candidatus Nanopelagicales bacterium]MCF8536775.1 CDP-glucose 4,6-dehydratase [Candidatus Nanopelagicales bacterium]MCF8541760.1 CDP-glucose 4,6-dehydratase [Candidatus Nanopelagicales bacterium]MCF8556199.1 CDP-glucose 4,6-dehydratase [Candidatus Nanopelagicales bacterium]
MRFLITGHTGFKGTWLSLMLQQRGHSVSGLALDPEPGSLFDRIALSDHFEHDIRGDIRDPEVTQAALSTVRPDVVMHLAAQPLVRESYRNPRGTIETNVVGTLNMLEAVEATESVRAHLVVTTDKVYRNVGRVAGYAEDEPLGGDDPYSASKAMADILTHSWITSFRGPPTAIARAGNVIGGGDFGKDRLLPDIVTAIAAGQAPVLRYPESVRPWQHVLDCLQGYLALVDAMVDDPDATSHQGAWNFGPGPESFVTVSAVTDLAIEFFRADVRWEPDTTPTFEEATLLALDARKSTRELNWRNVLPFRDAVEWSVDWYAAVLQGADPEETTRGQINAFDQRVRDLGEPT